MFRADLTSVPLFQRQQLAYILPILAAEYAYKRLPDKFPHEDN